MNKRLFILLLLVLPGVAQAHSPIKGLGDFFNGMLHPLFVPAHILLVLALGLLIGQQGIRSNLYAVWGYLAGVAAGLAMAGAGIGFSDATVQELAVLVAAAIVGLAVVLSVRLPSVPLLLCAAAAGLLLGMDSLQADLAGQARRVALFGTGVSLYLLLLYPMALAETSNRYAWLRIGMRVIASWISASALLVLALLFAPA